MFTKYSLCMLIPARALVSYHNMTAFESLSNACQLSVSQFFAVKVSPS